MKREIRHHVRMYHTNQPPSQRRGLRIRPLPTPAPPAVRLTFGADTERVLRQSFDKAIPSDINSSIFVSIPSRGRLESLKNTLALLSSSQSNQSNYIVHVLIDEDEQDLYMPFLSTLNVLVDKAPYGHGNMKNAYLKQLERFFSTGCYFYWGTMPDDLTAIPPQWDQQIVSKINLYPDNIYALYSGNVIRGRNPAFCASCYTDCGRHERWLNTLHYPRNYPQNLALDYLKVIDVGEMFPIMARGLAPYAYEYWQNEEFVIGNDLIVGVLIQQLYKRFNINRNILALTQGLDCTDNRLTDHKMRVHPYNMERVVQISHKMAESINARR